jgi:hypothetical protein
MRRPTALNDPDAIGPDGTVRLRFYLAHANAHWFAAGCTECGRQAPIGVRPAIELMGSGDATAAVDAAGGASSSTSPRTPGPPRSCATTSAAGDARRPTTSRIGPVARPPDPLHNRFRAAIEETWCTSPLGVWLTEHHAEVARLLHRHRAPPWDRLAANFAAAGLTDGRGRKPNTETARLSGAQEAAQRAGADQCCAGRASKTRSASSVAPPASRSIAATPRRNPG